MHRKWLSLFILLSLVFCHCVYAKRYGSAFCQYDGFHCQTVRSGQTWSSLFPDAHDRDIVMRVNRMNTNIYSGEVIAVPDNLSESTIMDFSPFPRLVPAPNEKVIIIDPIAEAWAAYDPTGTLIRWGPASSGANFCRDIDQACITHKGSFRVFSLGSSDCFSTKFPVPDGGAPMPFCMYFNNGQALHGEPNGLPGYNASHGCVRLFVNDAEWLRYSFVEGPNSGNGFRGTRIVVKPYGVLDEEDSVDANNN